MIRNISPHTIANTVRMGASGRRPRAVFLATSNSDTELMRVAVNSRKCRIVQAHSLENAAGAFEILVASGFEGVITAINSNFAPIAESELVESGARAPSDISLEGTWEQVSQRGAFLTGKKVRVTVLEDDEAASEPPRNVAMLSALSSIRERLSNTIPKADLADYLREAREGAMYGESGCG